HCHGTAVAGIAAGRGNNGIGISGVAPEAQLVGLRILGNGPDELSADEMTALALTYKNQDVDIYNGSFGPADDGFFHTVGPIRRAAFRAGVEQGRGGKGSIFVFSGGNSRLENGNSNYNPNANSRYTIAVASVDHKGVQTFASSPGTNLMVSAPSRGLTMAEGITTTDLSDELGNATDTVNLNCDSIVGDADFRRCFGGTSASAPMVAGVVALMLEANPNLTWRDVQHILVDTATPTDLTDPTWNSDPDNFDPDPAPNLAGKLVSEKYGFGIVNATAAVDKAKTWTNVGEEVSPNPVTTIANVPLVDDGEIVASSTQYNDDILVESVEVIVNIEHAYTPDLELILTHTLPDGSAKSESVLAQSRSIEEFDASQVTNLRNYRFTSVQHWGESSAGTWTLEVVDNASDIDSSGGTFENWTLVLHGTNTFPSPVDDLVADLDLTYTGATIIIPGFEPLDNEGDTLLPLAQAIRDRADGANGNDNAWLFDYDHERGGFDPVDSVFPGVVLNAGDWGGEVITCNSGNFCAVGHDDDELDDSRDHFLTKRLGDLTSFDTSTLSLDFAYDPQDIEDPTETLEIDLFHDGAWDEAVWRGTTANDGDLQTDQADWIDVNLSLGSLASVTDWSDIRIRFEASRELEEISLFGDQDEVLLDDVILSGEKLSAPGDTETIFQDGFENGTFNVWTSTDTQWKISQIGDKGNSGELVLLFDWANASRQVSPGWAEAAGDALFATLVGLDLVDPDSGEGVPLHVIGNGFGATVASEAVERLAFYDIGVDHLTYLDPHDFNQGLVFDGAQSLDSLAQPTGYGAAVWNNVDFADVYYQTRGANGDMVSDTLVPRGRPIPGAYNFYIDESNHLPTAAEYDELNIWGDHEYVWEGFYLSTVNGQTPKDNDLAALTKDTPSPATNISVNDVGYAFSRVKNSATRPDPVFYQNVDRGPWAAGASYRESDFVAHGGSNYVARRAHNSRNANGGGNNG
ncbi:S8 family serine peptidase, partial [Planctomycetota bacterium]